MLDGKVTDTIFFDFVVQHLLRALDILRGLVHHFVAQSDTRRLSDFFNFAFGTIRDIIEHLANHSRNCNYIREGSRDIV